MKLTLRAATTALLLLSLASGVPAQEKSEPRLVTVAGEAEANARVTVKFVLE